MSNYEDKNLINDHDYDGIKELDNPLPDWWLVTFLATIIFAFFYFIHYEFSGGQTIAQELKEDLSQIEVLKNNAPDSGESEEELSQLLASGTSLKEGEAVYGAKCVACHGPQLQGLIGPNLTDDYWLHGAGKLTDISAVVRKGVLDKGMPAWETQLNSAEIKAVTVFIASRHGSNPPNPKAAQGEKFVGN